MSPEGEARGRHEFTGWNKSSCRPTYLAINCLLYWQLKHDVLRHRALCHETWQWDMASGGRHEDLSRAHVTSLDQSCFFIDRINCIRYNKNVYGTHGLPVRRCELRRNTWSDIRISMRTNVVYDTCIRISRSTMYLGCIWLVWVASQEMRTMSEHLICYPDLHKYTTAIPWVLYCVWCHNDKCSGYVLNYTL